MSNLFLGLPQRLLEEHVQTLVASSSVRIERIVSLGHVSDEGSWYDQDQSEWVVVLRGAARLRFFDSDELLEMKAGDYVDIPAHRRHRVEWTSPDEMTIWLAVHYGDSS